jgi:hypothetical protein
MSARLPHAGVLAQIRPIERDDLAVLLTRIDCAHAALKRIDDEWRMAGSRGVITATNGILTACVTSRSRRHWAYAKPPLGGLCSIVPDYGDEGVLRLDRLPDGGGKAEELRHAMGLRHARSSATADRLRPSRDAEEGAA